MNNAIDYFEFEIPGHVRDHITIAFKSPGLL